MSLQSLIDNPKELLELINDCLKPIILVNEILDKLPL
jgi:hypothetical protein